MCRYHQLCVGAWWYGHSRGTPGARSRGGRVGTGAQGDRRRRLSEGKWRDRPCSRTERTHRVHTQHLEMTHRVHAQRGTEGSRRAHAQSGHRVHRTPVCDSDIVRPKSLCKYVYTMLVVRKLWHCNSSIRLFSSNCPTRAKSSPQPSWPVYPPRRTFSQPSSPALHSHSSHVNMPPMPPLLPKLDVSSPRASPPNLPSSPSVTRTSRRRPRLERSTLRAHCSPQHALPIQVHPSLCSIRRQCRS